MVAAAESISTKAVKAAKKLLKKNESDALKTKALAKLVADKLGETVDHKMVKKWIEKSGKFVVDGKKVSLPQKRTVSPVSDVEASSKKAGAASESKSTSSIEEWRKENKIVLKHAKDGEDGAKESKRINKDSSYYPFLSFGEPSCKAEIAECLLRQCTEGNGFSKPSPIQAQAWPILLNQNNGRKRDMVGIAETGSGKTLAFALPALSTMMAGSATLPKRRSPRMLVLAPTRELAMQSDVVLQEFGTVAGLRSLVLYGGVPKHSQTAELKKRNVDCLVATPGRLKDLINEGSCDLSKVQHLVLDEADRMLDMGFEEDVKFIISQCMPREDGRQTAMFSATWPASIQEIAMTYMVDPIRVYVGFEAIVGSNGENSVDDSLSANKRVQQNVEVIEDRQREQRLRDLLRKHQGKKELILVFALYKKEAERLEYSLKREGFDVCSIHGNKNQEARTRALSEFKNGTCPILVATDVAARGLDIPNVGVVVNYTFPLTIEDYVHRIGRTGRAGKNGISYTFFQPTDKSHAGELQQVIKQAGQTPPEDLMKFGSTIKKKEHKLYGNFGPRGGGPMKKATKITFDYSDGESTTMMFRFLLVALLAWLASPFTPALKPTTSLVANVAQGIPQDYVEPPQEEDDQLRLALECAVKISGTVELEEGKAGANPMELLRYFNLTKLEEPNVKRVWKAVHTKLICVGEGRDIFGDPDENLETVTELGPIEAAKNALKAADSEAISNAGHLVVNFLGGESLIVGQVLDAACELVVNLTIAPTTKISFNSLSHKSIPNGVCGVTVVASQKEGKRDAAVDEKIATGEVYMYGNSWWTVDDGELFGDEA